MQQILVTLDYSADISDDVAFCPAIGTGSILSVEQVLVVLEHHLFLVGHRALNRSLEAPKGGIVVRRQGGMRALSRLTTILGKLRCLVLLRPAAA